jgi:tetratricopeptide (TPR) repeat protein
MNLLLSVELGWLTPYTAVRIGLGLIALALLAWTICGKATSQRDFLPLAAVLSVLWWMLAGRGDLESESKFIAVSLSAFAIGTLFGFVFSSTMGESDSVGKVRDWLVGGIAALTVAQVASGGHTVKKLLDVFVPQNHPDDLAAVAGMAVVYAVTGFFLMFFNRELILNLLLVKGRVAARDAFEKSAAAAGKKIVEAFGQAPGVLDWQTTAQQEPLELDPEVQGYVREVETRLRNGEKVDLEDIKKAAVVLNLGGENIRATEFLKLASQRNPDDEDLVMMLAKTLAELGERDQAIAQLLEFKKRNPKPSRIDKILGFYYLWSPDKLKESIQFTSSYLERVAPEDDGAIFNLACAYAQLYGESNDPELRKLALDKLKQAVSANKVWKERAVELTGIDGDFVSLKDDPEFKGLVQK